MAWGIGRLRVVGERGREREKNRGYSQGTRRNYVAPGTDTLLARYVQLQPYNGVSVLHCSAWLAPASIQNNTAFPYSVLN